MSLSVLINCTSAVRYWFPTFVTSHRVQDASETDKVSTGKVGRGGQCRKQQCLELALSGF